MCQFSSARSDFDGTDNEPIVKQCSFKDTVPQFAFGGDVPWSEMQRVRLRQPCTWRFVRGRRSLENGQEHPCICHTRPRHFSTSRITDIGVAMCFMFEFSASLLERFTQHLQAWHMQARRVGAVSCGFRHAVWSSVASFPAVLHW